MTKMSLKFPGSWLLIFVLLSGSAFAQQSPVLVRLAGNVAPALMRSQYAGHHDPTSVLRVTVALKLRNSGQLQQFLQAVQDPTSSVYHQFLTSQQFTAMYGPTQAQVSTVVAYLESQGLHVTDVTPDNLLIHVEEPSGVLEHTFGIQINDYTYNGRSVYGTLDNPQFPSDIAAMVESVIGLSNITLLHTMLVQAPAAAPLLGTPTGYSPQQIATAYNWPSITDTANGSGVMIAIATAESPNLASSDYDSFWSYYGLPSHSVSVIPVDGTGQNVTTAQRETTLDVERSGAMAPGVTLQVYDAVDASFSRFFDTYDAIISANQAQIMTTSWGAPESVTGATQANADDQLFETAAAQGIAVFAAAGDNGSSDGTTNPDEADYPSSDPYVVAAGGTTLTLNGNNTIASETAWSGTGGAQSSFFSEPSWQVGPGVPQNGVRNTSDISMDADPGTGYSLYFGGGWDGTWGGTSFVAPELAGLFADQITMSGSTRLGQANAAIYIDANNFYSTDFHDITSGSNGAFSAGVGWDHPTGWGSPNALELLTHIASGVVISAPQNLDVEYTQCINGFDKYFITWQPPAIGTPSGGYDTEYEYQSDGVWHSFQYGPGTEAHITFQAGINVGIQVRASNGSVWSPYNTDLFKTAPCSPAP